MKKKSLDHFREETGIFHKCLPVPHLQTLKTKSTNTSLDYKKIHPLTLRPFLGMHPKVYWLDENIKEGEQPEMCF